MNNKTMERIEIKHRGDGIYDIYLNDQWVASKGHYESVLDEIRSIIQYIDK